jgi:N utilization substance protein B
VSARSKARKRALDILYAADLRGVPVSEAMAAAIDLREIQNEGSLNEYTLTLVAGVTSHQAEIDDLLSNYSLGWSLERMPTVDRGILRLGVYEILWCDETPDAVAVAEAVALAVDLSTDESASFVNGLLGRVLEMKPRLGVVPEQAAKAPGSTPDATAEATTKTSPVDGRQPL